VPPPVRAHFIEHNAGDQGIKAAMLFHQGVALPASDVKETVGRVIDEPVHGIPDDIPSGARIAVSGNLAGKAFGDDGSFDSDDPTFTGVSGASIEAIVLYVHTGTEAPRG
jgi:hypothetical protein